MLSSMIVFIQMTILLQMFSWNAGFANFGKDVESNEDHDSEYKRKITLHKCTKRAQVEE